MRPWTRSLLEVAILATLALTLNLAGNDRVSLWDRDEPRYAGCVREMVASGDYIHPTFNAEPRYHKPILIYWLMRLSTWCLGDNTYGARFVSAVSGALACLVVRALGRRLFGPNIGLVAALAFATAPIVWAESKLATTDAFLMLCLTTCQFAIWELSQRASRAWAMTFWVALALAVLTKGPIGPVLLGAAQVLSCWFRGPTAWVGRLRWRWGLPIFGLITAPWFIAIGVISGGEFYRVAMGFHVIRRALHPLESHGGFPGYYITLGLLLFYPWSALIPPGILAAWQRRRAEPRMGFLLGWIIGPTLFLELVRTKLIHYALPIFPACALLVGWLVLAVAESDVNLRRWPLGRLALGLFTGIGIGLTVLLLAGSLVLPWPMLGPTALALAAILALGTICSLERFQAGATRRAAAILVTTWALFLFVLSTWFIPRIEPYRLSARVAHALERTATETGAAPLLAGYKAPSIVYEIGRPLPCFAGLEDLVARTRREGPVVAALNKHEVKRMRSDARLALEPRGLVEGFDVEHGRNDALQLVVIRAAESASANLATAPIEQPNVK